MDKIAKPQDLQAELRRLLAYVQSEKPSRERLAAEMRALADRVASTKTAIARTPREMEQRFEENLIALNHIEASAEDFGFSPKGAIEARRVMLQSYRDWTVAKRNLRSATTAGSAHAQTFQKIVQIVDRFSAANKALQQQGTRALQDIKDAAAEDQEFQERNQERKGNPQYGLDQQVTLFAEALETANDATSQLETAYDEMNRWALKFME